MAKEIKVENYLNEKGKVNVWPSKRGNKVKILEYLITKFKFYVVYNEKEVNEIIKEWHIFNDYVLLRRELIESKLLSRNKECTEYKVNEEKVKEIKNEVNLRKE